MANLNTGINLDERPLYLEIPNNTPITGLKYIAKVNGINYIAENLINGVSRGFIHYLNENDEEVTEIFYEYNGTSTTINEKIINLPDNFGTITEINESATLFEYITRDPHDKLYIVTEDFDKREVEEVEVDDKLSSFPINSIFFTADNNNPSNFLGGTWEQIAQGQFLVGVGTGTDKNSVQKTFGAGANEGEYEHIQTIDELARHKHSYNKNNGYKANVDASAGSGGRLMNNTEAQGNTSEDGLSKPMNVTPPSFGLYVWKRTA